MAEKPWSTSVATETWYPILADVVALHEAMMRELGEDPAPFVAGGREKLESALASPEWAGRKGEADLAEQAALLAIRVAQAHALIDNNKRLAYLAGVIFLRENGTPLPAEHSLTFGKRIVAAIEHEATITEVAAWIRMAIGNTGS